MGLDMYLSARKYLSGWNHSTSQQKREFTKLAALAGISDLITPEAPSGYLEFHVAYWRKANQVHKWFVDNVQDGNDDCGKYYVSRDQLEELRDLCKTVLATPEVAASTLPTQGGFFFGDTEYGAYYLDDIRSTVEQIDKALKCPAEWEFEYHSSW